MISVIICNIDPAKWAAIQKMYGMLLRDTPYEIIGIHDAPSMSAGYQRGLEQSRGDVLIFSHDDVEFLAPDFAARLAGHLQRYDLIGVAGTTRLVGAGWIQAGPPHVFGQVAHVNTNGPGYIVSLYGTHAPVIPGIHALDGLFLACRRVVAEQVRWDPATFAGWHCYDIDFTFRAYRAGYKLAVCNDLLAIHASGGSFDDRWKAYADKFAEKFHGQLAAGPVHPFQCAAVVVPSRLDLPAVMIPAHWGEPRSAAAGGPNVSIGW